MKTLSVAAAALAFVAQGVNAVEPLVHLNYSSYEGTPLSNGITQWLGLRYAAPPLGDLRFAAPQDPLPSTQEIISADTHGPTCLETAREGLASSPPTNVTSEDCLFMDIYAPSNATSNSSLPVMFFIQGGGFNKNSNANYNASALLLASDLNIILVSFNYRVGPYGFLASKELLAPGGSVNNGLKDQRHALKWVQKHIASFGGNPNHVVLSGDSAGAASINLHLLAYGGRNDNLFHGTAAESQSFAAVRSVPESQYQYDNLVIRTGCASSNNTLACLRSLNATALQTQNFNTPFPGAQNAPLFMYGPVLDADFIQQTPYSAYATGTFLRLPAIYGSVTNEGTIYAHANTSSYAESNTFLRDQFPALTPSHLRRINALYPVETTPQHFPNASNFWRQSANAYGELRYTCPGLFINGAYARLGVPAWNYHWDVRDAAAEVSGVGVSHVVEINAIWGPENVQGSPPPSYFPGGVNAALGPVVRAYWVSFVRSLDPNVWRAEGAPVWEVWGERGERVLRFRTNETRVVGVPGEQRERCAYLSGIGIEIGQ